MKSGLFLFEKLPSNQQYKAGAIEVKRTTCRVLVVEKEKIRKLAKPISRAFFSSEKLARMLVLEPQTK
jgi:hypothetical protein